MPDGQNGNTNGRVVTAYMPIFRDKLSKLERQGRGHSEEARKLRVALANADLNSHPSQTNGDCRCHLVVAQ